MASLDFFQDLTEKFKKQGIDYGIISIQRGKQGYKVHVFYDINDLESVNAAVEGCSTFLETLGELAEKFAKEPKKKKGGAGDKGKK